MSIKRLILILIFFKLYFNRIQGKETIYFLNGQKSLNMVHENFLSFSIDPAIILNFNLSSKSLQMAQNLSPAFIRIQGPSTEFLKFSGEEKLLFEENNFTVTPMIWKSLNYWIKNSNLTPVFGISDKNKTKGFWNPNSILPLLDLSGKMNLTSYWQLGHDCKDKSIVRYKHDLFTLKQVLEKHFSDRKYWKIVGSDLQQCLTRKNPALVQKTLEYLDDVANAVIWQEDNPTHFVSTPIPIWLVVPEPTEGTFSSGLLWAKQIGEASKTGYEVIFRKPSLQELSSETPVYWVSLIHKKLMGQNVLEIRTNSFPEPEVNIFSHCTKNSPKQGSVTILIVNNGSSQYKTSLRVASLPPSNIEIHSYIITSDGEDSADTYLNGEKIEFHEGKIEFNPRVEKIQSKKVIDLVSPGKSIGFFVLPDAQIPICSRKEEGNNFSSYPKPNHVELKAQIPEEYRRKFNPRNEEVQQELKQDQTLFRRFLIKKPKTQKENPEKATKLEIVFTERPVKDQKIPSNIKTVELELTNEEIKKILKERAKSKVVEENPQLTSQELEDILKEAAEKVLENPLRKRKRFAIPNILRKRSKKIKRDINMELLDLYKNKPYKQQIHATIRKFGETSKEKSEETQEDVFAELATSLENFAPPRKPFGRKSFLTDLLNEGSVAKIPFHHEEPPREKLSPGAKYLDERVRFLMEPSGMETFINEDLKEYQENLRYQKMVNNPKPKHSNEIRNMGKSEEAQPSKMEIGEVYAVGKGNHGKNIMRMGGLSSEVTVEKGNERIEDTKPKFDLEWESFRSGRGNQEENSSGVVGASLISEEFVTGNNKTSWKSISIENPSPLVVEAWEKEDNLRENKEKQIAGIFMEEENFPSSRSTGKPSEISKPDWETNSVPQIPPFHSTIKPQLENWEKNSMENIKKSNQEDRARMIQEVWEMDNFPQESEGIPTKTVWEMNEFFPENFVQTSKIQTEEPYFNIEIGNLPTEEKSFSQKENTQSTFDVNGIKKKLLEMESPWLTKQTFFEELNPDQAKKSEKEKSLIETAKKTLENYFCDPKNEKMRFKRENLNITKNDIKNYKKIMSEQLRAMKLSRQVKNQTEDTPKKKRKLIPKTKSRLFPPKKDDNLSSEGEHLHIVIGKPYDPEKLNINERRRAKQVKKLKQRVENRKKLRNEVPEGSRRKRSSFNLQTNEVSDKKLNLNYKRRLFGPKSWKPQDISKIKKVPSYSIEVVDKREFLQRSAPFFQNKLKERRRRFKRNIGGGVDSFENEIENDGVFKNKKFTDVVTTPSADIVTNRSGTATTDFSYTQNGDEMLEGGIIPPHFIDMIMSAVNSTVSSFVHLTEKIGKQFSF